MKPLAKVTIGLVGQPMFKLQDKIRLLEAQGRKILHFEIGDTAWGTPKNVLEETVRSLFENGTHYTPSGGLIEFKEAIARDTYQEYGFRPDLEQIVVLPANSAVDFITSCLCEGDDEVVIPDPGFPTYASVLSYLGITAVPAVLYEQNGFKLKVDDIKFTPKTKLVILNSPSNPTGAIIDSDEIAKIYGLAVKNDVYLLSDEVYSRMSYQNDYLSPCWFDKCKERTILLKSFSKLYSMPGYRLGYIIAPPEIAEKVTLMFQTIYSCMPAFIQFAGITALQNTSDWVKEKMTYLKECRDLVVDKLNNKNRISCITPQGAFYVFFNIQETGMTSEEYADWMLKEKDIALLPGSCFGKHGEGFIRMCYAVDKKDLETALDKIC